MKDSADTSFNKFGMVNFILQILMMLGLGAILYLMARALPRIDDSEFNPPPHSASSHRLTVYLEKIDEWVNFFLEKFFRKLRLVILKLDNIVSQKLGKLKKETPKETGFPTEQTNGSKTQNGSSLQT